MTDPRLSAHEDRFLQRLTGALERWLESVGNVVLAPVRRLVAFPNPTGVYSTANLWDRELDQLIPELEQAARIGWSLVNQRATFSGTSSHVLNALNGSRNFLRGVPDLAHELIVDEIGESMSVGEPMTETVDRVRRALSITGTDFWPNRARAIAGTEVSRASNAGALAAAFQAERELGPMTKRWNSVRDEKVRQTHRISNGDEQPLASPFIVGGSPMMFPLDPNGPPDEVVNCRCDLSFRRADD